jgi:glycosyltransferase involved in cell wall biosynthesis
MKILALTQQFSGCGYHRLMLPVSQMTKEKATITDTIPDNFDYDIVFINRLWAKDDIFKLREKHNFKLVVDLDDYWILDHHHLDYEMYSTHGVDTMIVKHIKAADLVTCTHERLAERIKPYNSNVHILPNAIPYGKMQFTDVVNESDLVRLFWCGGISHEQDMKILKPVTADLLVSDFADKIKMVLGGYSDSNITEETIWKSMAASFTGGGLLNNVAYRGMSVFEYYTMYENADICLVPLRKTQFNAFKSNLKILEAAGKKLPVIVSEVDPYKGFPKEVVNYGNWEQNIRELVHDEQSRKEQGEALYQYCLKHYNFDEINQKRTELFKGLIS